MPKNVNVVVKFTPNHFIKITNQIGSLIKYNNYDSIQVYLCIA